jgi:hypothetical protein
MKVNFCFHVKTVSNAICLSVCMCLYWHIYLVTVTLMIECIFTFQSQPRY